MCFALSFLRVGVFFLEKKERLLAVCDWYFYLIIREKKVAIELVLRSVVFCIQ